MLMLKLKDFVSTARRPNVCQNNVNQISNVLILEKTAMKQFVCKFSMIKKQRLLFMKNIKTNIYISTTSKRFLSQIAIVELYNGPENKSTSLRLL